MRRRRTLIAGYDAGGEWPQNTSNGRARMKTEQLVCQEG
jgi:hypothetical protein